jgi:hypothetical protein
MPAKRLRNQAKRSDSFRFEEIRQLGDMTAIRRA